MPTYRYECPSCSYEFDVVKGVAEIDDVEHCPSCGREKIEGCQRRLGRVYFYGEKPDDAFYSVPLGKVVNSRKAQNREAKDRGWEEVGNVGDIDKHITSTDTEREKKISSRWDEYLQG
jgi:putative FmdB family regulatory protein